MSGNCLIRLFFFTSLGSSSSSLSCWRNVPRRRTPFLCGRCFTKRGGRTRKKRIVHPCVRDQLTVTTVVSGYTNARTTWNEYFTGRVISKRVFGLRCLTPVLDTQRFKKTSASKTKNKRFDYGHVLMHRCKYAKRIRLWLCTVCVFALYSWRVMCLHTSYRNIIHLLFLIPRIIFTLVFNTL